MTEKKQVKKDLEEIKRRLEQIKIKTGEIKIILPVAPGKNIQRNFNKIIKILDKMLEKTSD